MAGEGYVVAFSRALRGAGLKVPASATINFAEALGMVGLEERSTAYWAGRATLVSRPEDLPVYDRVFDAFWRQRLPTMAQVLGAPPPPITLALDLGDDDFTVGRPHPMIDHRLRNERLLAEAADPEVAVILFDVVLGYGSHPDPAAEMIPALAKARKKNRSVAFVASVCGTDQDPQGLARQEAALRKAGVLLEGSNARAVMLSLSLVRK